MGRAEHDLNTIARDPTAPRFRKPRPDGAAPGGCPAHGRRARPARPGFILREAAALAALILIALCLMLAMTARHRAGAGLNRDLGNLRQIGQWTHAYAADSEDRAPTIDEAPNTTFPQLVPVPGEENANGAKHAIDILWRRTGRSSGPNAIELPISWFPFLLYNHLVIADYADLDLPDRRFIATGDVNRMNWTDDPIGKHDQGFWQPFQEPQSGGAPPPSHRRWPYSASYQLAPAWYDAGQSDWTSGLGRISQSSPGFIIPMNTLLEGQRLSSASFPSQKVLWHDYGDWYHARRPFSFLSAGSEGDPRTSVLTSDGSAGTRATADANPGWHPQTPASAGAHVLVYQPRDWEPPTSNGETAELIDAGYYRWTRGGLKGRDFGGTEIDTGQR